MGISFLQLSKIVTENNKLYKLLVRGIVPVFVWRFVGTRPLTKEQKEGGCGGGGDVLGSRSGIAGNKIHNSKWF